MAGNVNFRKPPIKEALLDIRVNLPEDTETKNLLDFYNKVKRDFPNKQTKVESTISFQLQLKEKKPSVSSKSKPIGYLFKSEDNSRIVQARLDGFTYNMLQPYKGWKSFRNSAQGLWNLYEKMFKPVSLTRIALRYINLIEIPSPFNDFKEYFLTAPEIAPGLPQGLSDFLMRLVLPDPKSQAIAIINEGIDKTKLSPNLFPLILDIDVFKNLESVPTKSIDIWEEFEYLRKYKNDIFIKSLTDKAKKLFN